MVLTKFNLSCKNKPTNKKKKKKKGQSKEDYRNSWVFDKWMDWIRSNRGRSRTDCWLEQHHRFRAVRNSVVIRYSPDRRDRRHWAAYCSHHGSTIRETILLHQSVLLISNQKPTMLWLIVNWLSNSVTIGKCVRWKPIIGKMNENITLPVTPDI